MCFSAPASFIAGGALSAAGVATLSKTKKKREIPFTSIPLLFGVQQLTEGVVWVSFGIPTLNLIAAYIYLFISHVFWPIYVPFSVFLLEKNKSRKTIIAFFFVVGACVGSYLLWLIATQAAAPSIVNQSIFYPIMPQYGYYVLTLYVLATCGSCLASSHKLIKLFGVVLLISFAISGICYTQTFISVWCYFAALLSVIVYVFIARKDKKR